VKAISKATYAESMTTSGMKPSLPGFVPLFYDLRVEIGRLRALSHPVLIDPLERQPAWRNGWAGTTIHDKQWRTLR